MHDGGGDRSQTLSALKRLVPPPARPRVPVRARFADGGAVAGSQAEPAAGGIGAHARPDPARHARRRARGQPTSSTFLLRRSRSSLILVRMLLLVALARRHARLGAHPASRRPLHAAGVDRRARLQRGARDRARRALARPQRLPAARGRGGRRRLDRRDGCDRRGAALPAVRVLQQANAGKPAALNPGIARRARPGRDRRRRHGLRGGDARAGSCRSPARPTLAPSRGNTKVGNRRGLLGRWQHIEYVMGFNLDRRLYDVLRCMPTVPGAIGAFRRTRSPTSAACRAQPWPRTRTSRSPSAAPAGASSTPRRRGRGPRRRRRWPRSGASATAGATARCRRSGSTGGGRAAGRAPHRPARAALPGPLPDPAATARAADRRLRPLRDRLPRHAVGRGLLGRASPRSRACSAGTPSRLDGESPGGCGRCHCSSWSIAS